MAGVDPWDYSVRELVWRMQAIMLEEWDRVAWLCFYMPRFSSRRMKPEDFHPIRSAKNQVNIGELLCWIKEMKNYLPHKLSEEEIEKRWQAFKKKHKNE